MIDVTLTLRGRQQVELRQLVVGGQTVTPAQFARRFGPDPSAVANIIRAARGVGLRAHWQAGDPIASLTGRAGAISRLFGVSLGRYEAPSGRRFYAPAQAPTIPPRLRPAVTAVSGLENYTQMAPRSIRQGGVYPADMISFYGIAPLRRAGFTGAGETVVFPELDSAISRSDLARFAGKFHLPPFDLTVRTDPTWGTPGSDPAEVMMDLEIVHAIASKAKLVVYASDASWAHGAKAEAAMVREHPGAIISESLGGCETREILASDRAASAAVNAKAVALGMSHFVSSGDHGAYGCRSGFAAGLSADFPSVLPTVTSVGGTSVFLSRSGSYGGEVVWGNAVEGWGGGGGISRHYRRPSWQAGPGVRQALSTGFRQVPDVAALGDENTGWYLIYGGGDAINAGTSAAAPLWAGMTALIDERLRRAHLRRVGFANPAIYWIARHAGRLGHPFHDVTTGNNFYYRAGPDWDFATGWGTPNATALAAAWQSYERSGGGSPGGPTPKPPKPKPPKPKPPKPAPGPRPRAGRYCGFTDQGKSICFDVSAGGRSVSNVRTESVVNCTPSSTWTWTLTLTGSPATIQPSMFFSYPYDGSLTSSDPAFSNIRATYSLQGTLDTAGAASGTINLRRISFDYSGTHYECSSAPYGWHTRQGA